MFLLFKVGWLVGWYCCSCRPRGGPVKAEIYWMGATCAMPRHVGAMLWYATPRGRQVPEGDQALTHPTPPPQLHPYSPARGCGCRTQVGPSTQPALPPPGARRCGCRIQVGQRTWPEPHFTPRHDGCRIQVGQRTWPEPHCTPRHDGCRIQVGQRTPQHQLVEIDGSTSPIGQAS